MVKLMMFSASLLLAAAHAAAATLGLGTMSPGTASYSSGAVIGRVMHDHHGPPLRVQPHGGESVLMPLLDAGELDFAIASVVEAGDAFAGRHSFTGKPLTRLRVAAVLFPLRVALFVRADSDIHAIADLAGRRLPAGYAAMASVARLQEAILANGGLAMSDIEPVMVSNVLGGAERFVSGRADAFFFAVGAARVSEIDASLPLRMLPLADDPAARRRLRVALEGGYLGMLSPSPGMAGVTGPVAVLAFDNLLLTASHVRAETVSALVEGIVAHREELARGFAPFRDLDAALPDESGMPVPYHPGALRPRHAP